MLLTSKLQTQYGGGGAPAPVLSGFSSTALYKGVEFDVTTDTASGTLFYVVVPTAATAPDSDQIKAGTDGSDAAATESGSIPVAGVETNFDVPRSLADSTAYDIYVVQETTEFSNIATAEFTTPNTIASGGYDGTAADFISFGNGVVATSQADSAGGNNAVAITDDAATGTGQVGIQISPIVLADGVNYIEFIFRKVSGDGDSLRVRFTNFSETPLANIDLGTGSVTSGAPFDSIAVTDLTGGFFKVEISHDMTGLGDLNGAVLMQLLDGGSVTLARDGTQNVMIHNAFVSDELA